MWVNEYLLELHGEARGQEIIADIDHRYALQIHWAFFCPQFTFHAIVSQLFPHIQDSGIFLMAVISLSGPATIQRPL